MDAKISKAELREIWCRDSPEAARDSERSVEQRGADDYPEAASLSLSPPGEVRRSAHNEGRMVSTIPPTMEPYVPFLASS